MNADQWLEQLKNKNPDMYANCDQFVLDELKKVYEESHPNQET